MDGSDQNPLVFVVLNIYEGLLSVCDMHMYDVSNLDHLHWSFNKLYVSLSWIVTLAFPKVPTIETEGWKPNIIPKEFCFPKELHPLKEHQT